MKKFNSLRDTTLDEYGSVLDAIERDGFVITLSVKHDKYSTPYNTGKDYTPEVVARWVAGHWFMGSLSLSVHCDDVMLAGSAVEVHGIECNISKGSNEYISDLANELINEALFEGNKLRNQVLSSVSTDVLIAEILKRVDATERR